MSSIKKTSLVDVPVLLLVFVRPDKLRQVFDVIKKARPSVLLLVSDGPRKDVASDLKNITDSRKVVEDIDWDCQVHKLYFEENHGMYATFKNALDYTFSIVDRCIFLEDDIVTSVSFFQFCADLLEKYKDDLRVNMICGMNHLGEYKGPQSDYFFSRGASIWGHAYWRRTYEQFYNFDYGDDQYIMDLVIEDDVQYNVFSDVFKGYLKDKNFGGHPAGPEFFLYLNRCLNSFVNIIPTKNMVQSIGYGDESSHSTHLHKLPAAIQALYNMKIHEYEFPLKHPKYVISDNNYFREIMKITARSHPFLKFCRKSESIFRRIVYSDFNVKYFGRIFKRNMAR
jgi:hypothetical protein